MRRTALVSLALTGLASFATTPALAAPGANTTGLICGFVPVNDPSTEPGTRSGVLSDGPLVILDDANAPETGMLTCTIQVDHPTHGGTDGPSVSAAGTGVFVLGPAFVTFTAGAEADVYLCPSFTDASEDLTYYFNDTDGIWSTDPNTPCSLAFGSGEPNEEEKLIDSIVCPILAIVFPPDGDVPGVRDCRPGDKRLIDSIVCPILAIVFPPEGDVPRIWDCPPYGTI